MISLTSKLGDALIRRAEQREPDFVVHNARGEYLRRWWLIPRNPLLNVYLHKFVDDDEDRALHDHPWPSLSLMLRGALIEWTFRHPALGLKGGLESREIHAGDWRFRGSRFAHRLVLTRGWDAPRPGGIPRLPLITQHRDGQHSVAGEAWTLFITGPRVRQWGFYCPRGWVHWRDFVSGADKGKLGRGCA